MTRFELSDIESYPAGGSQVDTLWSYSDRHGQQHYSGAIKSAHLVLRGPSHHQKPEVWI